MEKILQGGLFIPNDILFDPNLNSTETILMAIIAKGANPGGCFLNNKFLGELVNLTNRSCHNLLTSINQKGYLKNCRVNNFHIFNKNKEAYKNITASRVIFPIIDTFDFIELKKEFNEDSKKNRKIVKNILKKYFALDFQKTKVNLDHYILIYRAYTIFGENKLLEALKIMSKIPIVKEKLSLECIFKVSIIRIALSENKKEDITNLEIYLNNCIEFEEYFNIRR